MSASEQFPPNEELVRLAREGGPHSDAAAGELLQRARLKFLPFILQRADPASSEDIISAASERMWLKLSQFDTSKGSFEDWAFAIVRNCVIDHYRALQRDTSHTSALADEMGSSIDIAEQTLLRDQINRALGELTDLDRELLVLSAVHGLSADELRRIFASRGLKLTRSAIYNRIHRARRKVGAALSES